MYTKLYTDCNCTRIAPTFRFRAFRSSCAFLRIQIISVYTSVYTSHSIPCSFSDFLIFGESHKSLILGLIAMGATLAIGAYSNF